MNAGRAVCRQAHQVEAIAGQAIGIESTERAGDGVGTVFSPNAFGVAVEYRGMVDRRWRNGRGDVDGHGVVIEQPCTIGGAHSERGRAGEACAALVSQASQCGVDLGLCAGERQAQSNKVVITQRSKSHSRIVRVFVEHVIVEC